MARWGKDEDGTVLTNHVGELTIGDTVFPCAVLPDGTRVLSERGVSEALGHIRSGTEYAKKKGTGTDSQLPVFMMGRVADYMSEELAGVLKNPIPYRHPHGGRRALGFSAELLPSICEAWLAARDANALTKAQGRKAAAAEMIIRGLARVGIVALVDEATGYQKVREKDELYRILEAYISKELLPWAKRFPDNFYEEICRLRGIECKKGRNWPQFIGKLTNDVVYRRMLPGVLDELKSKNPVTDKGYRLHRHHQYLNDTIGHSALREHILQVIVLMRAADTWHGFMRLLNRVLPILDAPTPLLELPESTPVA